MTTERIRRIRRPEYEAAEVVTSGQVAVTSSYLGNEATKVTKLKVRRFESEPAYVRVNIGTTRNMGNYESLRVDVSISAPCYPEEIDKVVGMLGDKAAAFMDAELEKFE
jgi:hypothetical protein